MRLIVIFFLFSAVKLHAQTPAFNKIAVTDTAFYYSYTSGLATKIGLNDLASSMDAYRFRLWTSTQIIDITESVEGKLSGQLIQWTDEYVNDGEKPTNRTFHQVRGIDLDTVRMIKALVGDYGIIDLPMGDSIKGWEAGLDGITYIVEFSTPKLYSYKTYWSPLAQESVAAAVVFQRFIDSVLVLVKSHDFSKKFTSVVPFESYWNGGPGVSVRPLTYEEREKYRLERKRYRRKSSRGGSG